MKYIKKFENFLYEYIQNNEILLLKYLNMSEKDKLKDLVVNNPYILRDYLMDLDKNSLDQKKIDIREELIDETIDINDALQELDNDFLEKFYDYIKSNLSDIIVYDMEYDDKPSWYYLRDPKLVKKQWLVHLTNHSDDIYKNGFKYGVKDITKLGLTRHLSDHFKSSFGFNFAYTIDDFFEYGKGSHGVHKLKYGDSIILFQASGIRCWHYSDDEYQVIFEGSKAENIIQLFYDNDVWYIKSRLTGKVLVKKSDVKDIIKWVDDNYSLYYKHIFNKLIK